MSNSTDDGGGGPGDRDLPGPDDAEGRLPSPRPDRSPESVLRTVLGALRTNDDPIENAGVRTAYEFASPEYRRQVGGSFDAFYDHLQGPIYRTLVDHREAKRGRLVRDEDRACEKVVVTDGDGDATTYEFTLSTPDEGDHQGCWTIADVELVYVGVSPNHQHMPVVEFDDAAVKCSEGDVLRDALLEASGVSPHNEAAQYANCNGKGLCGTCAVEVVEGDVTEKTAQEKRRLRLPPHDENDDQDFRLACQCRVLGDLKVRKHEGFWGEHVEEYDDAGQSEDRPVGTENDERSPADGESGSTAGADGNGLSLGDEAESLLDDTEDVIGDE